MAQKISVFEGDDASPEAVEPTVELLKSLDDTLEFVYPPVEPHLEDLKSWRVPAEISDAIDDSDSVLFGSAREIHRPILYYLRFEYGGGLFAHVRPVEYIPGVKSPLADPDGIDYTIVREAQEGLYFAGEGELEDLQEQMPEITGQRHETRIVDFGPGKYAIKVMTDENARRIARFGCELAMQKSSGGSVRLTCSTKSNVLPESDGLLQSAVEGIAAEYPQIEYEHLYVDNMANQLVIDPQRFDVVVTPNIAGDILSDLGAGTVGGLGLAPSACFNEEFAYFEPVHGTAPDIAGQNIINPTAMMLSAAMMLEFLDRDRSAERLRDAIRGTYAAGETLTPDQGGSASTTEFARAVESRL